MADENLAAKLVANMIARNMYGFPDGTSNRLRLARRAGEQYGNKREVFEVAGYPLEDELDATDGALEYFRSAYERDEVASRIIDLPAETCWGTPPKIVTPDGDEDSFTEQFDEFARRLNLWSTFQRADKLTRLGYFSVTLIGARTATDIELREPLQARSLDDVVLLEPYAQEWVELATLSGDPNDPRHNQPEMYMLNLTGGLQGQRDEGPQANMEMHWTRVLHTTEGALDSLVFGRPALKPVFNRIKDREKVYAATGEAYWQEAVRILNVMLDPDARISDDDLKTMMDQLGELTHDLRRHFGGSGVNLEAIGGSTPDPTGAVGTLERAIAAGSGIPTRILFGNQTGERASTEDRKQWLSQMADRQHNHCEPMFVRHLLDRLKMAGVQEIPDDYMVQWEPLYRESRAEIEQANMSVANAAKALTPIGGDPSTMVVIDEEGIASLAPMKQDESADERGEAFMGDMDTDADG